jgi:phosphomannomutase / phosphoglucomutase
MKFSLPKLSNKERQPTTATKKSLDIRLRVRTLWLAGALVAGMVAAGVLWQAYTDVAAMHAQAVARSAESLTANSLLALQGYIDRLKATLEGAAARQSLIAAALSTDSSAQQAEATELAKLLPGVTRVMLLPASLGAPLQSESPPVGFAVIEQMNAYAQNKTMPQGEVHWLEQGKPYLELLSPVLGSDGVLLGFVLATFPMDVLAKQFQGLAVEDGYIEVEQRILGADARSLFTRGDAGLKGAMPQFERPVAGTSWHLKIWKPADVSAESPAGLGYYVTLVAVALGGVLAVFSGLAWVVQNAIRRDCATLLALFKDIIADKPISAKHTQLTDFQPALDAVMQMVRDGTLLSRHISGSGKPGLVKSKARFELEDHMGGLEVSESGQDSASAAAGASDAEEAEAVAAGTVDAGVPEAIFRAYDIRAVVPETLNPAIAYVIGRAFGSEAYAQGQNEVLVARDGRLSSPEIAEAFMQGLEATGRTVTDLGEVPTPVMYFATHFLGANTGAMITGSHNPPDHNGFKLVMRGEALYGDGVTALRDRIQREEYVQGQGVRQQVDVIGDYWDRIAGDVTIARPLRVVVDAANGVAAKTAPELLRRIGCEPIELYCDVDGNFPNHGPDPSDPANLEALAAMVRMQKADVGVAFDGDGDRVAVVDSSGTIIWPDRLLMLFAKDLLSRSPGADIVFDVKCSYHLPRLITEHAGVPVLWKTGHSLMKAKLQETGALLGGEMSGHLFFNDRWYGFDDGVYAAVRLLELLSLDARSSAEIFADLPSGHSTPELRVPMREGEPAEFMRLFARKVALADAQLTTIDGVRADFADAWGLVRASNTTPCLTVRFEGDTLEALDRTQELFRAQMLAVRGDLKLPF